MASKELFFSQRQFAKITGISTVTLSKMVKGGNIKLQPDGKISSTEIRKLVIMQLKKKYTDSVFLFHLGSKEGCAKTIENLVEFCKKPKKKGDKSLIYYVSIDKLIDEIISYEPDSLSKANLEKHYIEHICKDFLSKYKQTMQSVFLSRSAENLCTEPDTVSLNDLPNGIVYDLIMQGHSDKFDVESNSGVVNTLKTLNGILDKKVESLINSLQLTDKDNKPLFERSDLTPDVLESVASFYDFITSRLVPLKTVLNQQCFALPNKIESIYTLECERLQSGNLKSNIGAVLHNNRFLTAINLPFEHSMQDEGMILLYITNVLASGLFSEIVFTCTREQYEEQMPDLLKAFFNNYESSGVKFTFAS